MAKNEKLIFNIFKPQKELEKIIESFWEFIYYYHADSYSNPSIFPNTSTLLIFFSDHIINKSELLLSGPCTKSIKLPFSTDCNYFVVEFKPLTLSHLFNFKVSQSVDKIIDASALLGKKTKAYLLQQLSGLNKTEEIKKVFENYFKDSFQKSIAIDNNITSAINLLTISKGKEKLENIYNEISIGKRQFQRNFLNETGITLKDFARIIRVRSAADKVVEGVENPSDIIFESGFYDQSHYYKEFKVFSGVNPTIFAERQRKLTHQPK